LHFLISMASAMSWRYSAWSASTASIPPCAIPQRLRHVRRAAAANALRVEEVLLGPAKACGEKRQKSVVVFKVWVAKMDATPTRMVVLWGCEPLTNQFAGI
jgi:hypothetical protein